MRKITLLILIAVFALNSYSQEEILKLRAENSVAKVESKMVPVPFYVAQLPLPYVNSISSLLFGNCVTVTNLNFVGNSSSIGYFNDPDSTLGMVSGLIMTSGSIFNIPGPNVQNAIGTDNGLPGDSLLDTVLNGYTTYDATSLEFEFIPLADTLLACKFIFGSDEYPEFAMSSFNDVFGFFIYDTVTNTYQNAATIPGTNQIVSINNLNNGQTNSGPCVNCAYYVDNIGGTEIEYDGYTLIIPVTIPVTANKLYRFKIAIADAGDGIYDSGVLIEAGSFRGKSKEAIAQFNTMSTNNVVKFVNTSSHAKFYLWDFGDGSTSTDENPVHTYTADGNYTVQLISYNHCYADTTSMNIQVSGSNIGVVDFDLSKSVKVYPNPAESFVVVEVDHINSQLEYSILSIDGRELKQGFLNDNKSYIDLKDLDGHIFFIRLRSLDHQTVTLQVIKK